MDTNGGVNEIIDLREPTDVCVIGSGPAGLVVAAQLTRRNISVTLLESGAVDHDPDRQQLSAATVGGDPINNFNAIENRTRRLAGNSNAWVVKTAGKKADAQMGLRYGLIDAQDMTERSWVAGSGWPLDFEDLDPWFRLAHEHFAIGQADYHPTEEDRGSALGDGFWNDFDARWFRFGLSDEFRSRLVNELAASPLCRIETDATVVELVRAERGGEITSVRYRTSNRTTGADEVGTVEASRFVLACGAIENARLLLASDRGNGGIGNEHGNVGRYFMDHPLFSIGHIDVDSNDPIDAMAFFDLADVGTGVAHGYAATSAALCEELEATRLAFSIFPRPNDRHLDAADTLKWLVQNPHPQLKAPKKLLRSLATIASGADYFPRAAYNSLVRHRSILPGYGRGGWGDGVDGMGFTRLEVVLQCEQPPLIDSRVSLSYDNDANGSPLPRVDWHIGEQVRTSVLAVQERLAAHVKEAGLGTYVPRAGSFDELGVPSSMAHHMGTTRMSHRPKDGVVTPDGRVHNVPNLFVAGSSVFPTSGYVNPTLTIIALAERLADHLATGQGGTGQTTGSARISRSADALSD